jgi:hypothetical protein
MPSIRMRTVAMSVAGVAIAGYFGSTAFADEPGISAEKIVNDCASNFCELHPTDIREVTGAQQQSSQAAWNCGNQDVTKSLEVSHTSSTSTNFNVEASVEAGLTKVLSASVTTSIGHEWTASDTVTDTIGTTVPPGSVAWVMSAPALTQVTGKLEVHYPSRQAGHFFWFVEPVVFTGPSQKGAKGNDVIFNRPMTDDERTQVCTSQAPGSVNLGPGSGNLVTGDGLVLTDDKLDPAGANASPPQGDALGEPPAQDPGTPSSATPGDQGQQSDQGQQGG